MKALLLLVAPLALCCCDPAPAPDCSQWQEKAHTEGIRADREERRAMSAEMRAAKVEAMLRQLQDAVISDKPSPSPNK